MAEHNQFTSAEAKQLAARLLLEQGVEVPESEIMAILRGFKPQQYTVALRGDRNYQIHDGEGLIS